MEAPVDEESPLDEEVPLEEEIPCDEEGAFLAERDAFLEEGLRLFT